jgi:hypothetical protein
MADEDGGWEGGREALAAPISHGHESNGLKYPHNDASCHRRHKRERLGPVRQRRKRSKKAASARKEKGADATRKALSL